jgi:enoyl-CoA hydratase/carnithine racemase
MSTSYVTIEHDGPVALVRFDRKKNLNAFDGQLILELTDVARSFHDDLETRAVVLTGSKEYFSAGADLEDLASRNDPTLSDLERQPCPRSPSLRWNGSRLVPVLHCPSPATGG